MSSKHSCFKQFDEKLAEHNGRLAMGVQVTKDLGLKARLLIATEKIDKAKRKPIPVVMASYCPFCGEKLEGGAA